MIRVLRILFYNSKISILVMRITDCTNYCVVCLIFDTKSVTPEKKILNGMFLKLIKIIIMTVFI